MASITRVNLPNILAGIGSFDSTRRAIGHPARGNGQVYAGVDAVKVLDGIALGKTFTADVWATQRGECVPLLKHFWRAWGTRRAYLTCSGARSSRQQGTVVRRRNSTASTRRNVVCDRGMCREAQPSHFAAKLSCKTSLQRCTIGRSLQSHTAAAVEGRAAANAAAAPSQAPFDLPCSSWRLLVAGALAMGATMVAPAVVAWRQQLAVQGSVLGATAFRRPRSPMAMRQTWHTTDLAKKQEFPCPQLSGCVRGVNPLLGAYLAGESNTAEVRMRDVSARTRAVAVVIIGTAIGGGTTRRVRCKIVVGEPVNRPGAMLACGR